MQYRHSINFNYVLYSLRKQIGRKRYNDFMAVFRSQHYMIPSVLFHTANSAMKPYKREAEIIFGLLENNKENLYNFIGEYTEYKAFLHAPYKQQPILERKDNKDYINRGSGHTNRNSIRYPKKCRKTAWNRFYKLFPHLKPQ